MRSSAEISVISRSARPRRKLLGGCRPIAATIDHRLGEKYPAIIVNSSRVLAVSETTLLAQIAGRTILVHQTGQHAGRNCATGATAVEESRRQRVRTAVGRCRTRRLVQRRGRRCLSPVWRLLCSVSVRVSRWSKPLERGLPIAFCSACACQARLRCAFWCAVPSFESQDRYALRNRTPRLRPFSGSAPRAGVPADHAQPEAEIGLHSFRDRHCGVSLERWIS
jgi:hypothetical protein